MAHRRPLHALEKWAYDAASLVSGTDVTKTNLIINTVLADMVAKNQNNLSDETALQLQGALTQMVFAADCISGRAQIVRIPDEAYNAVCKSELTDKDIDDLRRSEHLPWQMFAIELNHCESQLAVVVSTLKYLQSRAEDAQRTLGIDENTLAELASIFYVDPDEDNGLAMAFIPTPNTSKYALTNLLNTLLGGDEPIVGSGLLEIKPAALALARLDSMPYLQWETTDGDTPSMETIYKLIAFVIADNGEKTKVYEPSTEPQSHSKKKKKRKQCQAHIYEMGVSWSKAYKAYREAVKSGNHGGHKRPHIRRGHFHRFRVGPRDGEVRYVTYWLPPKLVGDTSKYKPSNQGHIIG